MCRLEEEEIITMDESKRLAFGVVLDELCKIGLFTGKYDAKHGSDDFMYGVFAVMSCISEKVSDEEYESFCEVFGENIAASKLKHKIEVEASIIPHLTTNP